MRRPTPVSPTSTSLTTSRICLTLITLLAFLTTALSTPSPFILHPLPLPNPQNAPLSLPPRATKPFLLRVMPLGASITVGYRSSDGNGYRKFLREQLRYAGWDVDMVGGMANGTMKDNQNEGHFGDTIDAVEAAALKSVGMQPNVILINVGTNDGIRNVHITGADTRIDDLMTELFAAIPNTTIILSTLIPNTQVQRVVERLSAEYRNVAARRRAQGDRVVLAEMSYFVQSGQLVDGTHPNDDGYREMAAVWWAAIQQAEEEGMLHAPNKVAPGSAVSVLGGANGTREVQGLDDGPVEDPGLPAYIAPPQPDTGVGVVVGIGRGLWVVLGLQVLSVFWGFLGFL
ncbi:SGNH hydrolase-type esterase domain-containing protein [Aspergillus aurantiobrunneus]